jgi:hypothetical protein
MGVTAEWLALDITFGYSNISKSNYILGSQ